MSQESESFDHQRVQQIFVQHKIREILLGKLLFSEVSVFDLLSDSFVICCVPAFKDVNNYSFRLLLAFFAFGLSGSGSSFFRFFRIDVVQSLSHNIVNVHNLNITAKGLLHQLRQGLAT